MAYTTTAVTITDTGKRSTTSSSAEEADLMNSGSAFTLNGVEVTWEEKAILNTNPTLAKLSTAGDATTQFTHGEIDHLGVQAPKWTVRGVLNWSVSADKAKIQHLRKLSRTKGYKTLSCDIADFLDGTGDSSTVNVRVDSVRLMHRPNSNILEYNITLFETS